MTACLFDWPLHIKLLGQTFTHAAPQQNNVRRTGVSFCGTAPKAYNHEAQGAPFWYGSLLSCLQAFRGDVSLVSDDL